MRRLDNSIARSDDDEKASDIAIRQCSGKYNAYVVTLKLAALCFSTFGRLHGFASCYFGE